VFIARQKGGMGACKGLDPDAKKDALKTNNRHTPPDPLSSDLFASPPHHEKSVLRKNVWTGSSGSYPERLTCASQRRFTFTMS
jgi:hypothetical protein